MALIGEAQFLRDLLDAEGALLQQFDCALGYLPLDKERRRPMYHMLTKSRQILGRDAELVGKPCHLMGQGISLVQEVHELVEMHVRTRQALLSVAFLVQDVTIDQVKQLISEGLAQQVDALQLVPAFGALAVEQVIIEAEVASLFIADVQHMRLMQIGQVDDIPAYMQLADQYIA